MIMLRILCSGAPRSGAVDILRALDKTGWDVDLARSVSEGPMCPVSENNIIREARDKKAEFLIYMLDDLFLDDPTLLLRLPEHDVPVVDSLIPFSREGHLYWHFYQYLNGWHYSDSPYGKSGLQQVYSSSFGMCCIREDILQDRSLDPLWEEDINADGTRRPFGCPDTFLCQKLHKRNIPVYVDTDVVADHIKPLRIKQVMDIIRPWAQGVAKSGSISSYALPSINAGYQDGLPVSDSYREVQQTLILPPELERAELNRKKEAA